MNYKSIFNYDNIKIEDLNISARLKNNLLHHKILMFDDFLKCTDERIKNFYGLGQKSIDEALNLKNNPENVYALIQIEEEEIEDFDKVSMLEETTNDEFIETIYSDFNFNDLGMSIRLKNCLYQNKINSVSLFLKTPISIIKTYKSLGKKTFEEVLKIKLQLLDINNSDNTSRILYLFIKKITSNGPKTIIFIKNYLATNTNYDTNLFIDDLNKLKNENKIDILTDGIAIKKISIKDYINSIEDTKIKNIMLMRLNGYTLEEIGNNIGVTRERIRQITYKFFNNLPDVYESKYKDVYEKYNFNEKEFSKIYNESKETYYFLKLAYDAGSYDILWGLKTSDFTDNQKNIIKKLRNIIKLFGKEIYCSKIEIIMALAEEYASNTITFEKFTTIYNTFVKMHPEIDLDISDERSIEGILSRQDNIIFDLGRKFRYIELLLVDKSIVDSLHKALDIEDGYYSTLVVYNNNCDLMKELDIRNEYELHSYLKKNITYFPEIKLDRMPNFSLGRVDKHDFTLNKINELAPICIDDFLKIMEKNYGHKSNTFLSYLSTEFSDYINGDFIDSDVVEIKDSLILDLRKILTEPIYSLDLVKDILEKHNYININEIITKNNMYKIGYKIRNSYILRKDFDSVEDYFINLSKNNDFIPNENILESSTYNVSIKRVQKAYDIVSISDKEFITITKLKKLGIDKEIMNKFCNDVLSSFENINYFTVYNIKNTIDTSWIDDNGFDDIFYECLIETIDNIKYLRINNQKIYSFIDDNVEVDDIINEFMVDDSISVDELIDAIREKYGIDVSYDKLIYNNDKFYSRELNKLYLNKECYYKEVYNYE